MERWWWFISVDSTLAFVSFSASLIPQVRKHITDLYEDLRDGHNLISLLEVLSGVTLVHSLHKLFFKTFLTAPSFPQSSLHSVLIHQKISPPISSVLLLLCPPLSSSYISFRKAALLRRGRTPRGLLLSSSSEERMRRRRKELREYVWVPTLCLIASVFASTQQVELWGCMSVECCVTNCVLASHDTNGSVVGWQHQNITTSGAFTVSTSHTQKKKNIKNKTTALKIPSWN